MIDHKKLEEAFDPRFKLFHELMARKIRDILLVSSPYDAWIMEEDCRLSEKIVSEYRGLNLSNPPRLTWVSSMEKALATLSKKNFDLVIIMPRVADAKAFGMGEAVKKKDAQLPVVLFSHKAQLAPENRGPSPVRGVDRTFVWTGDTEILLAVVKSTEDMLNAPHDTRAAGIRVIIFVEDSPAYLSSLLPILYREVVTQTQAVIGEGLNQEHRLLAMRARPKILVAENFEQAVALYERYEPFILGVISDVRFPRNGEPDDAAGLRLLKKIKKERFDVPLLLASSQTSNAEKAAAIPAAFVDKNSPTLLSQVHTFFVDHLGFGDFVFRMPDGREIARASKLSLLVQHLKEIPDESFRFHCSRNDFSRWLFARSEIELASRVRPLRDNDFEDAESHRRYLISVIQARRQRRQKGVVVNFDPDGFDPETEFFKIGNGSLGGKARGLAFLSSFLCRQRPIQQHFEKVRIVIPQTLVITTDGFDAFVEKNDLRGLSKENIPDEQIAEAFMAADFPGEIHTALGTFLNQVRYPLAVRSSSLLEDAQFRAYAGLYKTYMLPNDDPDLSCRLDQLINALKMVYASTYYKEPRAFSRRVGHRTEEEKMAVIVQQMVGERYGAYFYPAISGVAQSHNYYPFSAMKPEDGIATIALGLGKTVVEGERTLRFSPRHPQLLPQFSAIDDILENAQREFYAVKMGGPCLRLGVNEAVTLEKRDVMNAEGEPPVRLLAGTYNPDEHRIRDVTQPGGFPVLTFSSVLKYNRVPLAGILSEVLDLCKEGMGCPVEIEFSVNIPAADGAPPQFAVLQVRPMTAREELMKVEIREEEIEKAFCFSTHALGNAVKRDMSDILLVRPDAFDPGRTREIAQEIGRVNAELMQEERRYVLVGPGRWGTNDPWLGIPVNWSDICGVGAIIEAVHPALKAEPSQGSHFFHNITTLGINHMTVSGNQNDFLDWHWLGSLTPLRVLDYVSHLRLDDPITLKVDGRKSNGVMYV